MNSRRNVIALSGEPSSESEGGLGQSSDSSESDGGGQEVTRGPHSRINSSRHQSLNNQKKGPRREGLKTLKSKNNLFTDLLNCVFYRLNDTPQRRSERATGRVRSFCGKLEPVRMDKPFDGSDGILVFEFIKTLIREGSLDAMSEAQFYLFFDECYENSPMTPLCPLGIVQQLKKEE